MLESFAILTIFVGAFVKFTIYVTVAVFRYLGELAVFTLPSVVMLSFFLPAPTQLLFQVTSFFIKLLLSFGYTIIFVFTQVLNYFPK